MPPPRRSNIFPATNSAASKRPSLVRLLVGDMLQNHYFTHAPAFLGPQSAEGALFTERAAGSARDARLPLHRAVHGRGRGREGASSGVTRPPQRPGRQAPLLGQHCPRPWETGSRSTPAQQAGESADTRPPEAAARLSSCLCHGRSVRVHITQPRQAHLWGRHELRLNAQQHPQLVRRRLLHGRTKQSSDARILPHLTPQRISLQACSASTLPSQVTL